MSQTERGVVITPIPSQSALQYCIDHASGSPLIDQLIRLGLLPGFSRAVLVTVGNPPTGVPYARATGLGLVQPEFWLIDAIISYLTALPGSLVILEDSNSAPDDPYLLQQRHPPCLCTGTTLLWPLTHAAATRDVVEGVMPWAKGWRDVVFFTATPKRFVMQQRQCSALTDEQLFQVADSTKRIVVDVFRGEGYLLCEREEKRQ